MKVRILFWLVWHERSKANAGDTMRSPYDISSAINYHFNEYRNLQQRKTQKQVSIQKWSPPPRAGNLEHLSNALHAEALALLYTLNISGQMGCVRVIFETDSVILKQAISSDDYNLASLGALFQEIKMQLNFAFADVKINVCPRSCNNAAHTLSMHGVCMGKGNYETWLDHFPEFVMNIVVDDLVSMSL
uniref:Uncharacterized protein n=1 Tax=Avena sativa TaxID=4498 RepID=A0ACD5XYZ3_AVESA